MGNLVTRRCDESYSDYRNYRKKTVWVFRKNC